MLYLDPERPILGPMQIEIEAREHGTGSGISVHQTGHGGGENCDWCSQAVVEGWPKALESLPRHLAGQVEL